MKQVVFSLTLFCGLALAQSPLTFKNVIIIVQENRTPDNLFHDLCAAPFSVNCGTGTGFYDIKTDNWLDKTSPTGVTQPVPIPLAALYDMGHCHSCWVSQYDNGLMDGEALVKCQPTQNCSGSHPGFAYVDNSTGALNPYFTLVIQNGWSNTFFQTNQGPSFPAHQYLFGGTAAPSAALDAIGTFWGENYGPQNTNVSCNNNVPIQLIDNAGNETHGNTYPSCGEHWTLGDLLNQNNISWRYYTNSIGTSFAPYGIWTAPAAIKHDCGSNGKDCVGGQWTQHVDTNSADILTDIANCNLRQVNWVIPSGPNSDHSGDNTGGGPAWVASIVNAIGNSYANSSGSCDYWGQNKSGSETAIFLTWDDWGGWPDHIAPPIRPFPDSNNELGFRVPLVAVSAYTPSGYISNQTADFGSLLRFVEQNYGLVEGALGLADARSTGDMTDFFCFSCGAKSYLTLSAGDFDKVNQGDPDDD